MADAASCVLTKRYKISAMHNLENTNLSVEENREIFGLCYRLHGHDYRIDVSIKGPIDKKWGLVVDRDELDRIVNETIVKPYNKTNLNHAFTNTSGEALAVEFFLILKEALPPEMNLTQVTVVETHRNTFQCSV